MKPKMTLLLLPVLLSCVLAAGCTQEKARALRIAAVQFQVESIAAIDAIDKAINRELEAPPRTQAEVDNKFISRLTALAKAAAAAVDGEMNLDEDKLDRANDPFRIRIDPNVQEKRDAFKRQMYEQYTAFGNAFEDIEQGWLFAGKAVKRAAEPAQKLTAQLVSFAKVFDGNPPRLIQYRNELILAMEDAAANTTLPEADRRTRLLQLRERWHALLAEETALQESVMAQCLKAAMLGREVSALIDRFDKVSLEDITNLIATALDQAGSITGKDLSEIKLKTNAFFDSIENDQVLKDSVNLMLEELNKAGISTVPKGASSPAARDRGRESGRSHIGRRQSHDREPGERRVE